MNAREHDIDNALASAEMARKEMAQIQDIQKNMERQAAEDRLRIIREAEAIRDNMLEEAKSKALALQLEQSWTIETVSMMEWTEQGWNEKFFFPLEDQRLLRNQYNSILQDK